jgi:hypothetical protein
MALAAASEIWHKAGVIWSADFNSRPVPAWRRVLLIGVSISTFVYASRCAAALDFLSSLHPKRG